MTYPVQIIEAIRTLQHAIHDNAKKHGWYETPVPFPQSIANIHSEVSEAFEAVKVGNPPDKHCPEFSSVEIELADIVIRVMDTCEYLGF